MLNLFDKNYDGWILDLKMGLEVPLNFIKKQNALNKYFIIFN